jgi:hypothetical protein
MKTGKGNYLVDTVCIVPESCLRPVKQLCLEQSIPQCSGHLDNSASSIHTMNVTPRRPFTPDGGPVPFIPHPSTKQALAVWIYRILPSSILKR